MQLKILGSSSAGNCYLFVSESGTLIVEAGIKFDKVKQNLNFDLSKVVGVICSHSDGDHSIALPAMLAAGLNCYSSAGTWKDLNIAHHRAHIIKAEQLFKIGSFSIIPFDTQHDCPEPFGFLIKEPEMGVTLFLTDSYYTKKKFTGLNNIIVEANYSFDIVNEKVGYTLEPWRKARIISSHMSIETLIDMLHANDLSQVGQIVLIHLSNSNSDERAFKQRIEATFGKPVIIANTGVVIDGFGDKVPF